jgi:glutaminase
MASLDSTATAIQHLIEEVHQRLSGLQDGKVADYIPELAKADPDDFAIVVATADGRTYAVGDSEKEFTIQSISKPFAYGLALKLLGREHMQGKVGVEPSGEAFNAISLDPVTGIPRNPMINAGAIATAAQIWEHDPETAEATLLGFLSDLAGRPLHIDTNVYRSERDTGHRNRAISHLLRNFNVIESDPEGGLDLYFRQCAIAVSCRDLAIMAASLACQGRNPISGMKALDADITIQMLALMGTCGMYDYAGQWLHDVGMPAKSGVGGGVLAVVPGRLGIAVYSPRLDPFGNSVRGIAVCEELSERLGLHLYNQNPRAITTIRRSYAGSHRHSRRWRCPAEAVILEGLGDRIRVVHAQGVLDFAATEQLLAELTAIAGDARVVVVDFHQVLELPPTSCSILLRQLGLIGLNPVTVLLSRGDHLASLMEAGHGLAMLPTIDAALEEAESILLRQEQRSMPSPAPAQASILEALDPEHRAALEGLLQSTSFQAGETAVRRHDPGDTLYIVQDGIFTTTIRLNLSNGLTKTTRLSTFSSGMCFGEISFLTGQPRSADVIADTDGRALLLRRESLDDLGRSHPEVVIALLRTLSCELGSKLASASHQLTLLEHY